MASVHGHIYGPVESSGGKVFEYYSRFKARPHVRRAYQILDSELGYVTWYPDKIPELWIKRIQRIVFFPTYQNEEELKEICQIGKGIGNSVITTEENDSILGGDPIHPLARQIRDIVHTGSSHYGMGLVCVTRRLANLNRDIISQTNHIIFFRQTSKADLKRLEEECGEEAGEIEHKSPYYFENI